MNDLISRQAAIDVVDDLKACISVDGYWAWMERLKKLPSAEPESCEYWDAESNYCALNRPSAEPERKKGKWNTDKESPEYATCSVCGHCDWDCTESEYFNYCPNCGADMRGEDEDATD